MPYMQARVKETHRTRLPGISPVAWFDVVPIFPGIMTRRTDIFGNRLTRIRTPRGYETLHASWFDFRERPADAPAPEPEFVPVAEQTDDGLIRLTA